MGSVLLHSGVLATYSSDTCYAAQGEMLSLADNDTVVVWWDEHKVRTVRVIAIFDVTFDVCATVEVRNPQGEVVRPPPEPPVQWHESFRYFRISQTTVDGVDTAEAQLGLRFGSARNLRTRYPRWPKFVTVVAFWCFFSSAGPQLL
jgi:hypothetical protein